MTAASTAGAIAGALGFSVLLVPTLGTAGAQRVVIGLSMAAALAALVPPSATPARAGPAGGAWLARLGDVAAMAVLAGIAAWFAARVAPIPWQAIAYGRQAASLAGALAPGVRAEVDVPGGEGEPSVSCTYVGEGRAVSVAVTRTRQGVRNFHSAGKVQASSLPADMRLQRMLGHIPALAHPKPETALVVACGAGVTAGTFVLHPDVKRIVICDIEPLVPPTVAPMFGAENDHVVDGIARRNPHVVNGKEVEVVYGDGRHFLRTTREKFDLITSDPIDPWAKGCAALNTVEYYRACQAHLKPGGSVSLWLPLYESDLDTANSLIATFFEVFPEGIIWSNERAGKGYDAVLFGQAEPAAIDLDELARRLDRPDHRVARDSLAEVGFGASRSSPGKAPGAQDMAIALLATFAGQASRLGDWTHGAQLNIESNLRLQYLAGMSLNSCRGEEILRSLLAHYRFPDRTFLGSPAQLRALREALAAAGRKESTPLDPPSPRPADGSASRDADQSATRRIASEKSSRAG